MAAMSDSSSPSGLPRYFVSFAVRERLFLIALLAAFLLAAFTFRIPHIAMWVGFAFAGYSAVANDSIQTLGTFIASNRDQKWWVLWAYIGGIFLITMTYGWFKFSGDVSYQRLTSKGFNVAPTHFTFLQVAAPLFLLILTRLRMPVSTSILLLSCFASDQSGITSTLMKSVGGYMIAFVGSILIWGSLGRLMQKKFVGTPHPAWRVMQFITTGGLWAVWLAQDAANIAIYLPRTLNATQLMMFLAFIFVGLGILFFQRGEKIQEVVDEKSAVTDVRPAAIVDLVYGAILYYKMTSSIIPMSTTWVFIGLLGGRELALTWWSSREERTMGDAVRMVVRDLMTVGIGLAISLGLAVVINDVVRHAWIPGAMSVEEGACVHAQRGALEEITPYAAIPDMPAADDEENQPAMMHTHRRVGITFVEDGASYFLFETDGGDMTFHLNHAQPFALQTIGGTPVSVTDNGETDACGELDAWYGAALEAGTYVMVFAASDFETTVMVIED